MSSNLQTRYSTTLGPVKNKPSCCQDNSGTIMGKLEVSFRYRGRMLKYPKIGMKVEKENREKCKVFGLMAVLPATTHPDMISDDICL